MKVAVRSAPRWVSLSSEAQGRSFFQNFKCLIRRHHPRRVPTRAHLINMSGQPSHLHARHFKTSEATLRPTNLQKRAHRYCRNRRRWQWTGRASSPIDSPPRRETQGSEGARALLSRLMRTILWLAKVARHIDHGQDEKEVRHTRADRDNAPGSGPNCLSV